MRTMLTAATLSAAAGLALMATPALAQQPMNIMSGYNAGSNGMGAASNAEKKAQRVPGMKAQEKEFPLGATWTIVSVNGKPVNGADRPSFNVDTQYRARGYGGCNTFAATAFPLRNQQLAVGPLAITKKPCQKGTGSVEQAFLMGLRTAGQWDLVGSQLVIRSGNGELRFDRTL